MKTFELTNVNVLTNVKSGFKPTKWDETMTVCSTLVFWDAPKRESSFALGNPHVWQENNLQMIKTCHWKIYGKLAHWENYSDFIKYVPYHFFPCPALMEWYLPEYGSPSAFFLVIYIATLHSPFIVFYSCSSAIIFDMMEN